MSELLFHNELINNIVMPLVENLPQKLAMNIAVKLSKIDLDSNKMFELFMIIMDNIVIIHELCPIVALRKLIKFMFNIYRNKQCKYFNQIFPEDETEQSAIPFIDLEHLLKNKTTESKRFNQLIFDLFNLTENNFEANKKVKMQLTELKHLNINLLYCFNNQNIKDCDVEGTSHYNIKPEKVNSYHLILKNKNLNLIGWFENYLLEFTFDEQSDLKQNYFEEKDKDGNNALMLCAKFGNYRSFNNVMVFYEDKKYYNEIINNDGLTVEELASTIEIKQAIDKLFERNINYIEITVNGNTTLVSTERPVSVKMTDFNGKEVKVILDGSNVSVNKGGLNIC